MLNVDLNPRKCCTLQPQDDAPQIELRLDRVPTIPSKKAPFSSSDSSTYSDDWISHSSSVIENVSENIKKRNIENIVE